MLRKILLTVRIGVNSLLLHKLRSALAVLGILIGITAVIWLVAMGQGVSYQAQQQIKDLGATNIIVRSVKPPTNSSQGGSGMFIEYGVLRDDYQRILSNLPESVLQHAVPMREISQEVRYADRTTEGRLVGCTPEYFSLNHLQRSRGRLLTDRDVHRVENVAVLAEETAQQLFGFENPIGRSIQIGTDFYVIVGQTARRDPTAAIGGSLSAQDYNKDVYIPYSTLRSRIGDMVFLSRSGSREGEIVQLSQVTVGVADINQVDQAADVIRTLMEKYHETEDYAIVVPKELLRQAELMEMLFNLLLVLIAGISLVVGGIGIMNIMLATVTERTREIGIRRALGATRSDIVTQFLVESLVLTSIGGLLGVALGFLCGPAVNQLRELAEMLAPEAMQTLPPIIKDLQPRIAAWSIGASFIISVMVGVFFGLYPAFRAARMDPIEALRHE